MEAVHRQGWLARFLDRGEASAQGAGYAVSGGNV